MKPGDFGLVRTTGLVAALIRLGTRSPANHAFVYVGDNQIVEAQPNGACVSPADKYARVRWSSFDLSDEQRDRIVQAALAQVGAPYGWLDIAVITMASFGVDMGWAAHRVNALGNRICSQLVAVSYAAAGVHVAPAWLCPAQVTPADLLVNVDGL